MSTDIDLVRKSLDSFFNSMITTLKASGTSDDARMARFLETVHKHAMELPGIGEPGQLESDEPDEDDFWERHVWRKDSTACSVEGCMALEGDPGWADHEDPAVISPSLPDETNNHEETERS